MPTSERLSDIVIKRHLDAGYQAIPWDMPNDQGFLAGIDFDKILAQPQPKKIVQALPVQPLYAAIKRTGFADSLAILELVSQDQFTRFLDYDVWHRGQLVPGKCLAWLMSYMALGKEAVAERFMDLEEEYQLSLLVGKLQVVDLEQLEALPGEEQDAFFAMPCNQVYYRIISNFESEMQAIANLIEAIKDTDLKYAYALISHAGFMPPNESMEQLLQFRNARLEEDGFVTYGESLSIFTPLDLADLTNKWRPASAAASSNGLVYDANEPSLAFADRVLAHLRTLGWDLDEQFQVHQGLLFLANSLTAASHVEADDTKGLQALLEQLRAIWGLGLAYLAADDVAVAAAIIKAEHPKTLFRAGYSLIHGVRQGLLAHLASWEVPGMAALAAEVRHGRFGGALQVIEKQLQPCLGLEMAEILRGIFNRYPMCPQLIGDRDQGQRITFVALSSWTIFAQWQAYAEAQVIFSQLTGSLSQRVTLDRRLHTLLLAGILGAEPGAGAVTTQQIAAFCSLEREPLSQAMQALNENLTATIIAQRTQWQLGAERAAAKAEVPCRLTANTAIHLLADRMLDLVLAQGQGEEAVAKLVLTVSE